MKAKKIIATAVASAMIIGGSLVLAGCDQEPETTDETTTTAEETESETETETEQTTTEETETETTESEVTTEPVETTSDYDPYKLYKLDELEVESFTDSKPVLKFYPLEDYSLALKTDMGVFSIPNEESKIDKITIFLDDQAFELECFMDDVGSTGRAYLVSSNGNIFIYTESSLMDDYEALNVYKVSDGSISFVGSMEGMDVGAYLGQPFTDPESFEIVDAGGMGISMALAGKFKVGDDGMPVSISDVWEFREYNPEILYYFENDMTGTDISSSEEKTVTAGDMFMFLATDRETYVDIQTMTMSGDFIRIDITDTVKAAKEERGEYYDIFYAIFDLGIRDNQTTYAD